MALVCRPSMASTLVLLVLVVLCLKPTDAQIGVCNGRKGDNLPSPQETVNLYMSNGISKMRIYDPDPATLQALQGSNIDLLLDVPIGQQLQSLGSDPTAATQWVQTNVVPYASSVKYIAVGNEVMPGDPNAQYVLAAMQNVQKALSSADLAGRIKVSTAVKSDLLTNTSPPSNSVFSGSAADYFSPIVKFLKSNGSPLLANIYPYFAYKFDGQDIPLPFALFTSPGTVVTDNNGLQYQNLFDALVDCFYAAMEKVGGDGVGIVVSESGWPSEGNDAATVDNAKTYYSNLIRHVGNGTPKRQGQALETYLFAMFDENQKPNDEDEKHFGLFTPSQQNKYGISFK